MSDPRRRDDRCLGRRASRVVCDPVGEILGAERVIPIERVTERIELTKKRGPTDLTDFENEDVYERIKEIRKGEPLD